jgi:periplasmic mercuric ion binding protein
VAILMLPAWATAANKTVVLTIPTMDCATRPITIRLALMHIVGVSKAKVSYDKREARVTYDDAKTNVAALTKATTDVGYPSFESDTQPSRHFFDRASGAP